MGKTRKKKKSTIKIGVVLKKALWMIIPALITVMLQLLARKTTWFGTWYTRNIYPIYVNTIGRLMSVVPVSVVEFGLYILILWVLWITLSSVYKTVKKQERGFILFGRWIHKILTTAAVLLMVYTMTCGINYYAISFSAMEGFSVRKSSVEELEELYNLDQDYGSFNKIAADIIASDSGNWFNTFVIDKGKKDGIEVDMNVIAGGGLVGIVTKTGDNWAQVRSIIDDLSSVSAQVLSTSDLCFVKGDLQLMEDGLIQLNQLKDSENTVSKGEKIVTSHVSDKYHEGILIGYVNELELDANNLTKSGTLVPAVDFEHLRTVLVITDLKQKVEE